MRIKFLACGLIALLLAVCSGCGGGKNEKSAAAGGESNTKQIVWKCSVYGSDRVFFKPLHWFYDELEKRSNGRFKIEMYYGEVLSPSKKVFDGIKGGLFESGLTGCIYTPGATPIGAVPYNLSCLCPTRPDDQFRWILEYNQHPLVQKELEKYDAMLFLPLTVGTALYEIYSNKPINTLDDFKGMRIRDIPPADLVWQKLGANIVSGTYGEVYEMASRHMVDAVSVEPYTATGFRLQEAFKYLTDGVALKNAATYIFCSKKAYNALPEDIKKIYNDLMKEAPAKFQAIWEEESVKSRKVIEDAGVKITPFPTEERAKLVKLYRDHVWPQQKELLDSKGVPSKEIFDHLIGISKKYGVVVPD